VAGFTLLEVLIALTIFAIAFGALATLFQTSSRQASLASELRQVNELAKAQLARFGKDLPLETGTSGGTTTDGLRWEAEISLAGLANTDEDFALYHIRIEASMIDGSSGGIGLTTLRLGQP